MLLDQINCFENQFLKLCLIIQFTITMKHKYNILLELK